MSMLKAAIALVVLLVAFPHADGKWKRNRLGRLKERNTLTT
jgi:hypothetical protein